MAILYELTDAYAALIAALDDCTTLDQQDEILAQLAGINDAIGDKAEAYAKVMQNMLAAIAARDAEIDRLEALNNRDKNAVKRLKENIRYAMEIAGATEINTTIGKWKIQRNPHKVIVDDVALIPEAYIIPQPPKPDSRAILNAWKTDGELIPGTHVVQEESVRFK